MSEFLLLHKTILTTLIRVRMWARRDRRRLAGYKARRALNVAQSLFVVKLPK